ncbi:glycosyltransferase family 4 protein, partial [Pontibacter qinzhouensis]
MRLFIIPSWFPTKDYPVSGIMIKEQTEAFCRAYPAVKVGMSVFGNTEHKYLLLAKDHVKNIKKVLFADTRPYTNKLLPNLTTYHKPAFSWTRRFRNGNIKAIVEANIYNLKAFEADAGPVDVIHAHVGYPAGIIAMEIARKLKIPYCLTERMGPFPSIYTRDKNNQLLAYYKQPYQESALNIAVSPFQVQAMRRQGINNITMIPNFLDEHKFRPAEHSKRQNHLFTFFSLSFISPQKGTDQLVYAIKEVTKTQQQVRFRIGGDGSHLPAFKTL